MVVKIYLDHQSGVIQTTFDGQPGEEIVLPGYKAIREGTTVKKPGEEQTIGQIDRSVLGDVARQLAEIFRMLDPDADISIC